MSTPQNRNRKRFTVDSLFDDTRPQAVGVRDLTEAKLIEIARIHPDPSQPRRTFDPDRLDELVASIKAEGILQPIVVRFDTETDRYVIVHGERRWRASKRAGLREVPAIVRDVPVERRLVQQLMENVVRDDLNAVDRAAALRALHGQLGEPSWDVVADTVGIKRSRLFQLLGTEKLSSGAQEDIREGRLSEKQSRALQGLSETRQEALRELILAEKLSAADATRLARAYKAMEVRPEGDIDAARAVLQQAYRFIFATDDEQRFAQTASLLGAIRAARSGAPRDRSELASLASTLDARRYQEERLGQELNTLARSLASLEGSGSARSERIETTLRDLRDTLETLLD
jgi:ParB family transcriptional regulator, chromosome partitioning protein